MKLKLTNYTGLFLLISALNISESFSQNPEINTSRPYEKNFSEELYVRTDRDLYITGEKVWLKIFKLNRLTHAPVNISKVVYVDLLDIDNNPVRQLKIGVDGNSGSADFILPDTLRSGNYIIRSYTSWMKNFSKDLFSYKRISVINPFENINDFKIPSGSSIPDSVIFSPEGGHLIRDIETRVGFRSSDKEGNPVAMSGALIYENNDTICFIKTGSNGYGWASLKPSGNGPILLVTPNKNGTVKKFPLPGIKNEGLTFSVTGKSEKSGLKVKINKSPGFRSDSTKLYLKIYSAGLINEINEITFDNYRGTGLLQKDLPDGLSRLMITDEHENLITDRWLYNDYEKTIHYNITLQNPSFPQRENIKFSISATDNKGIPVESDLSVSVVKAFTINKNSFDSNKYSQLPGLASIISDNYPPDINDFLMFYTPQDPMKNQDWNNLQSIPYYLPELEGHLINGHINFRKSGEPFRNGDITLSFVGKVALCQFTKTDEQGNFNFVTKEHGLREIVIQPLSPEIKDCYVDLNNPFSTTFNRYNHGLFYLDSSKLGDINNAIISMQIKNIYEPLLQQGVKKAANGSPDFYGKPDNTILMSKYIELTSLKEVVKEIIPGVSTAKKNDKINFKLLNLNQSSPFENNPLVLVDGIPVNDYEKILNINSKEIEKIDVFNSRYFISYVSLDGILHFVSKKGDLGVIDFDRSVFRLEYDLLQNRNNFYSPDYHSEIVKNNRIPDFRNTLYWNPDLHTDITGKTEVEFYSSDEPTEYIITIEGITPDGKTGVSSFPLIIKSQ